MKRAKLLFFGLLIGVLFAPQSKAQVQSFALQWIDYDPAFVQSCQTQKPVLVYFYSKDCSHCQQMESETLSNPNVIAYLRNNFILTRSEFSSKRPILFHGENIEERALFALFGINSTPTSMILVQVNGKEALVNSSEGFMSASEYVDFLKESQSIFKAAGGVIPCRK